MKPRDIIKIVGYLDGVLTLLSLAFLFLAATVPQWLPQSTQNWETSSIRALSSHIFRDVEDQLTWRMFADEIVRSLLHRGYAESIWIITGLVGTFMVIGVMASVILVKSTNPNECQEEALSMARFWMFVNVLFVLICSVSFLALPYMIMLWVLIPVRAVLIGMVWWYLGELNRRRSWMGLKDINYKIERQDKEDAGRRQDVPRVSSLMPFRFAFRHSQRRVGGMED